jgi:hypothetical protein
VETVKALVKFEKQKTKTKKEVKKFMTKRSHLRQPAYPIMLMDRSEISRGTFDCDDLSEMLDERDRLISEAE